MVGYRTSKRLTYFLMIRQLHFDKHETLALELERIVFNGIGNNLLHDIKPSDDLQKIIGLNSVCIDYLSCASNALASLTDDQFVKCLREPHSSSSEEPMLTSQNMEQSSTVSLPDFIHFQPNFDEAACDISTPKDVTKQTRRGRSLNSAQSSSSQNCSQTEEIVSELQKISQQLVTDEKGPPAAVPNSFLSTAVPSSSRQNSNTACDPLSNTTLGQSSCSNLSTGSELKTLSTVPEVDNVAGSSKLVKNSSQESSPPLSAARSPDILEANECYTHYKITKIESDESDNLAAAETPILSSSDTCPLIATATSSFDPQSVYLNSCSGKPTKTKFSDFGNPADYANNSASSRPAKNSSNVRQNINGGASKLSASNTVNPPPATPAHRLSDDTELFSFNRENKLKVLAILGEGWKIQVAFEKKVKNEIPDVGKRSMEEILYSVFGYQASEFVEFKKDPKNRTSVRLIPSYKPENYDTLLAMI